MDKISKYHSIKLRDRVISVIAKNGMYRAAAIKNTQTALTAQRNHNLPSLPAGILSRHLAAASMLAVFLKGEERIMLEAEGKTIIKRVYAEAIQVGEARGYIDYDKSADFGSHNENYHYLNESLYKVTRVLYDKSEPVIGIIKVHKGNVQTGLEKYFYQSEQIPTIVRLDASIDKKGIIEQSGGIILQAMPGTTHKEFSDIAKSKTVSLSITKFLNEGLMPEEVLKEILPFEFDVIKNDRVDFFCRCSKERYLDMLVTLGLKEILEMQKEGKNELICQYCNEHYYLTNDDFTKIIDTQKAIVN